MSVLPTGVATPAPGRRALAGPVATGALELAVVAGAYVVGARLGLLLAFDNPNVTPVWPPTGIALAALVVRGPRVWPAITLGAIVANVTNGASAETALAISVGNTLAPVVAWLLLTRVVRFDPRLRRVEDVVALLVLGGLASMLVSATLGVTSLSATGAMGSSAPWSVWVVWWLGDVGGVVLFAPVILTTMSRTREDGGPFVRPVETVAWLALTAVVTAAVSSSPVPLTFLAVPLVAGGALRFRQEGAAAAAAIVAAISTWATGSGLGPYQHLPTTTKLLLVGSFNGTLTLLSLLVAAVVQERISAQLAIERVAQDFERRALHDPLTGLANRALLLDRVGHALTRRDPQPVSLLFLDLDDFKSVNDSLGHTAGDDLLAAVGWRLRACVRPGDTVARLGGDEFAVLIDDTDDGTDATAVAERILAALRAPFLVQGTEVGVGVSIGIATSPVASTADQLVSHADLALYRAKERSGCYDVYEPGMRSEMRDRQEMKADLMRALDRDQLELRFQPIVALASGEVVGGEALVRWRHPRRGLVAPATFVPLAEQTGLIDPIGRWVLEHACAQAVEWQRSWPAASPLLTTVNVSPCQLQRRETVLDMLDVIMASDLDPRLLVLEITESALVDEAIAGIERLRGLGVRIAIDDFGTGYSSLSSLRRLPIDMVKIDREFMADDAGALTPAILRFLEALHIPSIVEGIERPDQLRLLRAAGCKQGQGFLFSEPLDAESFGEVYATSGRDMWRLGAAAR